MAFSIVGLSACKQSRIENEYSVQFSNIANCDSFWSLASRLHSFQRTAGMRLALPDHLIQTFKTLEDEGFRIVRRRSGTKRSIKFDDRTRSLVMDVKLPDSAWVRLTADQVFQASRSRKTKYVPAVSEILAISASDLPEPHDGLPVVDGVDEKDANMEQQ